MLLVFAASTHASTVTYSWAANTSLDGVSGEFIFDVPGLTEPRGSWSNSGDNVTLLSFQFIGTSQPSASFSQPVSVPTSLSSNGDILSMSGQWNIGVAWFLFQDPRADTVDTGGIKIAQGTWRWASATIDPPSSIPIPPALWLFGTGLLGLVGMTRK
jgi:hypothetical protein